MPKMSNKEPVDFTGVRKLVNNVVDLLDKIEHGEVRSKAAGKKLLTEYRISLEKVRKSVTGARAFARAFEFSLVSRKEALDAAHEDVVADTLPGLVPETKVEVPE